MHNSKLGDFGMALLDPRKTAKMLAELLNTNTEGGINSAITNMVHGIDQGNSMKKALLAIIGGLEKIRVYEDKILSEDNILLNPDTDGILIDNANDILSIQSVASSEISKIIVWLSVFSQSFCKMTNLNLIQGENQEQSITKLEQCLGLNKPSTILRECIKASPADFSSPEALLKRAIKGDGYYVVVNLLLDTLSEVMRFCHNRLLNGDPQKIIYHLHNHVFSELLSRNERGLKTYFSNDGKITNAAREVSKKKVFEMLTEVSRKLDLPVETVFSDNGDPIDSNFEAILQGLGYKAIAPVFKFPQLTKRKLNERGFTDQEQWEVISLLKEISKKLVNKEFQQYEHVFWMIYHFTQSQQ